MFFLNESLLLVKLANSAEPESELLRLSVDLLSCSEETRSLVMDEDEDDVGARGKLTSWLDSRERRCCC